MEHDGPIYSIPHIFGKMKRFNEQQIVIMIYIVELLCCAIMYVVSYLLQL
jgi:UDP-N-acetylmuramyl pentapeptide phosphotransferase/UDP-N-acetylglucosamine-1-phosphate transferase